jgi:RHH-type proline utilization regulon transcriptional repressor/proline dehydrogenase/delta 1-pyrroline-5-carboxylate dehydrogenase
MASSTLDAARHDRDAEAGEAPFAALLAETRAQGPLRAAITAAYRRPEPACLPGLIEAARLDPATEAAATATARRLVEALRAKPRRGGVEGLVQEYALSSQEGVALMCLAEALLRVPDRATRDALIRDKIASGDWRSHVGQSPSLFVNAATWGLVVTGRLTASVNETGLATALQRIIAKGGEPLIRKGVDMAMRMMGEQFVTGQTIAEALAHARRREARGFRYSYDMLGEAAVTMADADRYFRDYESAIHAIGVAAGGQGPTAGPGISVKLSALHPRYCRAQRDRVLGELLARLHRLCILARRYDIGLNIDAEEADRLELSLDLLEASCFAPELKGWNGIGFVVQAYGKRAPAVIDFVIDLGRRSGHRIMLRLVKGAYWTRPMRSSPNLPPITRAPSAPSMPWRVIIGWGNMNSSACMAWVSRFTKRSSARPSSTAPAASMRRSAPMRRCWPISCGACSKTAPIPPSSTASPTPGSASRIWLPILSPSRPRSIRRVLRIP